MRKHSFPMLAVLALALLSAAAFATTINSAIVSGNQLTIGGVGFNGSLTVTLNGQKLAVASSTSTQIVATMNPVPPVGSYRLTVKSGKASTFAYVTVPPSAAIVAQDAFANQTQATSGTFTSTTDGIFRVSYYAVASGPPPSGQNAITFCMSWTDEYGDHSLYDQTDVQFGLFAERVHVVRSLAGQLLSYGAQAYPGESYSWYITVEQLQ